MPHDDIVHAQALESGDYADEILFDHEALTVSLIHFADGSHSVRLDLPERGVSLVLDTPAWLDVDTVVPEISAEEPLLSSGFAVVERQEDDAVGYRLTIQGGDVVGRISMILLEEEVAQLRRALEASREAVEAADTLDHDIHEPRPG